MHRESVNVAASTLQWRPTNAPTASSRTDDIWFLDAEVGWAVNSNGHILKTEDGGASWTRQFAVGAYLRSIGFANSRVGWVGTLTPARRLYHTIDGGATWTQVGNLPTNAPARVCGIAVVNERVIYASGTNIPTDAPRMMKTTDGGQTWTAWDMRPFASILIDTYFTDEQMGWVVGGKADVPNPTDRDRIKPVVLFTSDGGQTWTNRLTGQEMHFPAGEWGWKIQFLDAQIGFVSLENLSDAAILKTVDGGQSWQRLQVNDPQINANLEGIGFINPSRGWVGGWGDANFQGGFSSATSDGGANWQSANEIGKFLNRFRFFGNPVTVGYASGDTVYKYSAQPVAAPTLALSAAPSLLGAQRIDTHAFPIKFPLLVPRGAKRLTLDVWTRFGQHVGCVFDETNPAPGHRTFHWDGRGQRGFPISCGAYIYRVNADDEAASGILTLCAGRSSSRSGPTVAALMAAPQHDLAWLKKALQLAIQLEFSTLPPYLLARWTIKNYESDPVSSSIREICLEEMFHFGLVCNLLTAIGGKPVLNTSDTVPAHPGPLPGGVRPELTVPLKRLSQDQAKVFMDIEFPQGGPIALAAATTYDSIGAFYDDIQAAFDALAPPLSSDHQLDGLLDLFKIDTPALVRTAIDMIKHQGEGSRESPEDSGPDDLAHYYRFAEMYHQRKLVKDPVTGNCTFSGPPLPLPDMWPMADIPAGGYQRADVTDAATWALIEQFDQQFTNMLQQLQSAWEQGERELLEAALGSMIGMKFTALELVQKPIPDGGGGTYGPCFRLTTAIVTPPSPPAGPPVSRWQRVRQILETASGSGHPFHDGQGRFWNKPLSEVLTLSVYGLPVIAPPGANRGKNSNLVKSLKGEPPFDDSEFPRMPLGKPPVSALDIAFIEQWIDDGCNEN